MMFLNKSGSSLRAKFTYMMLSLIALLLMIFSNLSFAATTVELKVLVISTGTAEQDLGLDLIDNMLDEMGVPYDILNASETNLTLETLVTDNEGNYNGIILTDTYLSIFPEHPAFPDNNEDSAQNSAFTLAEWQLLHQYEREFDVHESVLSGWPTSGEWSKATYDLDYGMDLATIASGSSFNGVWQLDGNHEVFEYVNSGNVIPITDYSLAVSPRIVNDGPVVPPTIIPLLTDKDSGKLLISKLIYEDGREVLLSTITNAWYLVHSQILNYEFLNFATQGVFIGSRKVYLQAHIDDMFIADEIWDPVTNTTDGSKTYRNTAQDIDNLVVANDKFLASFPTLTDFKLDLVFNGIGAAQAAPASVLLTATQDTFINSKRKTRSYGNNRKAFIVESNLKKQRALFDFELPENVNNLVSSAILNLKTDKNDTSYLSPGEGKICLVAEKWNEQATWNNRVKNENWSVQGGTFNIENCVTYMVDWGSAEDLWGKVTVDIGPLVNKWQSANVSKFGLIMVATNNNLIKVHTSEARNQNLRPNLSIDFLTSDPLTDAVIAQKNNFRFINHTLTHRDLYKSSGATYDIAHYEIEENLKVWQDLGLPDLNPASQVLVTGNHSGLEDAKSSDGTDPILKNYPEGLNTNLMNAMESLNVRYMASDPSRPNQGAEAYIPGTNIVLLPRYPTSLFYNVTNPDELTDEYNYIFYERYINAEQNPCFIAGAICKPRNYNQILAAEADTTLRHMLSYRPWPHFSHISNLHDYGDGRTLQYDWLTAVTKKYNDLLSLPIVNMDYYNIGEMTREKLEAKQANVRGLWYRSDNASTITITADAPVTLSITGAEYGEMYGGQSILKTEIGTGSNTFNVNRAINE